jgi:serine phosphatase RsbU (regulator of sigma subunit)
VPVEIQLAYGDTLESLELGDGDYLLGRAEGSDIRVPLMSVSRKHLRLRIENDRIHVENLSTTTGTFLDEELLGEGEVELPISSYIRVGEAKLWRGGTLSGFGAPLSRHENLHSRYTFTPDGEATGTARDRILRMLSSLFDLISSSPEDGSFEQEACSFVGKVVLADRVVILEDDGLGSPLVRRAAWFSSPDHQEKYRLSEHLITQVCHSRSSLLVEDALHNSPTDSYQSVRDLQVRSAIIAPLFDGERVRGILYADSLVTRQRYNEDDLQVLSAIARAVGVKRQRDDEEHERRRAARVQANLLPREMPRVEGTEIHGYLEMSKGVGGDLYLCSPRPSGRLLLAVGDVSGKGMAAALSMGASMMLLRILARLGGEPRHVLEEFHEQLRDTLPAERFVTLFVGEYDAESGQLLYASAGHEDAHLIRADGSLERLHSTGLPAGFDLDAHYEQQEVRLEPGDLLAVFTDGISEATTDGDIFYGEERAEKLFRRMHLDPLPSIREALFAEIHEYLQGQAASDDITLLLLRRCQS